MSFMRVASASTDDGWEIYPIAVDLKIDDGSRRASVNWPLFGAMGKQNTSEYWPFRMDQNGNIDFGSYGEFRNAWINLLEKEIRKWEICTYRDSPNDRDVVHRIEEIESL
ncbi:MAG: hypothetical protein OXC08_00085 [Thiotrichales bacterium]|nr:hypothetical protein [Thiotrichales bacterium]